MIHKSAIINGLQINLRSAQIKHLKIIRYAANINIRHPVHLFLKTFQIFVGNLRKNKMLAGNSAKTFKIQHNSSIFCFMSTFNSMN